MVKFTYHTDGEDKTSTHKDIAEKVDKLDFRQLDENNPLEQAQKFDKIKENPPEPGFMRVDVIKTDDDPPQLFSISKDDAGHEKRIREELVFTVDLYSAVQANIAKCPSNVVPMLIDQAQQLVMNEKKEYKPEKRANEFNWWWVILGLMMIPGIILLILVLL